MDERQICPVCALAANDDMRRCSCCGWNFAPLLGPPEELEAGLADARRQWKANCREEDLARREDALRQREEEAARLKDALRQRVEELGRKEEVLIHWENELKRKQEAVDQRKKEPQHREERSPLSLWRNSIGMEFVLISAGSFMMGSDKEKCLYVFGDETPQHRVTISKPFYLGKYAVTQAQWKVVMGNKPSHFAGRDNPVENVSWYDAQEFIKRLNAQEGHNRNRLPTEAEWEYAARAGTASAYFFGDDADSLESYAWYDKNSVRTSHPVGQKEANAWGLYDMHGNVREWVQDWYERWYYSVSPGCDPECPTIGSARVLRGGSWDYGARSCRSANRDHDTPDLRSFNLGFRLALSPE
jgi:formylglycine-generating enzyme required for sulfatase activity